jgi:phosphatidylinositol alpha-1,6-mannosyltransferase
MTKRGKILLLTTDFPPARGGGILTHSHFLVEALRTHGWEFCVLSEYYINCSDAEITSFSKKEKLTIYRLPDATDKFSLMKKIWFCYRITKEFKPDLIIGTGRHPTWFASISSKLSRIPLVTIGHGTEFTQRTSKYDFKINKWAYSRSKLIISISEYTKEIILKSGIKNKNIQVIPNPANEHNFKKLDNEQIENFKLAKNLRHRKVVLSVGSLSERKGQRVIIRSLPKIVETNPEILYVAIGPPVLKDQFYELANLLGVRENVYFPGIVTDEELVLWLNACDLFTMTSVSVNGDYEGYGIAVMEAALCGKTSIVSDNGGLKEAVKNEKTGLVVPENNTDRTTASILELLNNSTKLNYLSENAYTLARTKNTYEYIGKCYNKFISELL